MLINAAARTPARSKGRHKGVSSDAMRALAAISAQNVKRRAGDGSNAGSGGGDGNKSINELSDDTIQDMHLACLVKQPLQRGRSDNGHILRSSPDFLEILVALHQVAALWVDHQNLARSGGRSDHHFVMTVALV